MDEYEPLAIVGLAFRFPGDADSPEEFWRIMEERRCVMAEMPADRINIDAFYHDDTSRVDTVRRGNCIRHHHHVADNE
jgi:acyl transferase domain-containing protein